MFAGFLRVLGDLFPSANPADIKSAIHSFEKHGIVWKDLYSDELAPAVTQGDIFDSLELALEDADGSLAVWTGPAMLLSNSCDVDNQPYVIVAACFPAREYTNVGTLGYLKANQINSKFYLSRVPNLGDVIVDFAAVQSVRVQPLLRALEEGRVHRVVSLTMGGYYFLLAKLTAYFLRPRQVDEIRLPSAPPLRVRAREVVSRTGPLLRYLMRGREF